MDCYSSDDRCGYDFAVCQRYWEGVFAFAKEQRKKTRILNLKRSVNNLSMCPLTIEGIMGLLLTRDI
jgi:hypothetical protein